jgi:hypothetical protein
MSKCLELGFPEHHVQSPKISESEAFLKMLKNCLVKQFPYKQLSVQ